jgi:hypothetical protein
MANVKITDLGAYTNPVSTDVLPIVDVGADVTKKVSIADLLKNASAGTAAAPGIAFDGDNTGIYSPGADQVAISTNGTERMRIDSSGRVGINTIAPAAGYLLDVNGGIRTNAPSQIGLRLAANSAIRNDSAAQSTMYFDVSFGGSPHGNFVWRSSLNATERARIDTSGRLLVGTSTARTNFYNTTASAQVQIEGTNFQNSAASLTCNSVIPSDAPILAFNKSGGASVGSNTLVAVNHILGDIEFQGNDGTEFVRAALIKAEVDGTPGANDMPGRLIFSTTADGASTPTERMRISADGTVDIAGDLVLGPNNAPAIKSDTTGVTGADQITNMMSLTQAEYDAIVSPDANTFYVITA